MNFTNSKGYTRNKAIVIYTITTNMCIVSGDTQMEKEMKL